MRDSRLKPRFKMKPANPNHAGIGMCETRDHTNRRRFARTIRAEKPINISFLNSKIQPIHNGPGTEGFRQFLHF